MMNMIGELVRLPHNRWRRVECNWLAGLVVRGMIDMEDAAAMAADSAYGLAERAYRFGG